MWPLTLFRALLNPAGGSETSQRRVAGVLPKILYLDFDGVLHPVDAFRQIALSPGIENWMASGLPAPCDDEGRYLFMYCDILEAILAPFPEVGIVLSTSWAAAFGLEAASSRLPPSLRKRVVGATSNDGTNHHSQLKCLSRGRQVARHARTLGLKDWVALDDDARGWPRRQGSRDHVEVCDENRGLDDPLVQARLESRLQLMCGAMDRR